MSLPETLFWKQDTVGTDEKALTTNLIVDKSLDPAQNALIVKANGSINLHDIGTEGILPIAELSSANGGIFLRMDLQHCY